MDNLKKAIIESAHYLKEIEMKKLNIFWVGKGVDAKWVNLN